MKGKMCTKYIHCFAPNKEKGGKIVHQICACFFQNPYKEKRVKMVNLFVLKCSRIKPNIISIYDQLNKQYIAF